MGDPFACFAKTCQYYELYTNNSIDIINYLVNTVHNYLINYIGNLVNDIGNQINDILNQVSSTQILFNRNNNGSAFLPSHILVEGFQIEINKKILYLIVSNAQGIFPSAVIPPYWFPSTINELSNASAAR